MQKQNKYGVVEEGIWDQRKYKWSFGESVYHKTLPDAEDDIKQARKNGFEGQRPLSSPGRART